MSGAARGVRPRRRGPGRRFPVLAALLAAISLLAAAGAVVAAGAAWSPTVPLVYLKVPGLASPDRPPVAAVTSSGNPVNLEAYATPTDGGAITEVDFRVSPAGMNEWQTIDSETETAGPGAGVHAQFSWDTTQPLPGGGPLGGNPPPDGAYDIQAVAIEGNSTSRDTVTVGVANNSTYIGLEPVGSPLVGQVKLTATPDTNSGASNGFGPNYTPPSSVTFEAKPAGADDSRWKAISGAIGPTFSSSGTTFVATIDTRRYADGSPLADGRYDLSVTGTDQANPPDPFTGGELAGVVIDNGNPPPPTLDPIGGSSSGVVRLSATAADPIAGVASVAFQTSPAGAGTWSTAAVATAPPYTAELDTRGLGNGSYDVRALATTRADGQSASAIQTTAVNNSGLADYTHPTITNYLAPASSIRLLGTVSGGAPGETWAYGFTSSPPPVIDGSRLPYNSGGHPQLVLLQYTDASGWQIADVLRNPDLSGWQQSAIQPLGVTGQMTSSGEAWLAITTGSNQVAMFHRLPGGRFLFDQPDSTVLSPLFGPSHGSPYRIRLGQTASGETYGVLLNSGPSQPSGVSGALTILGPVRGGVNTTLRFGQLRRGVAGACGLGGQSACWSLQAAPPPPPLVVAPGSSTGDRVDHADLADVVPTGPGTGWAVLTDPLGSTGPLDALEQQPLALAHFTGPAASDWSYVKTGIDALDLTDNFDPGSRPALLDRHVQSTIATPQLYAADDRGVWISSSPTTIDGNGDRSSGNVIGYYDSASGSIRTSWCAGLPRTSYSCGSPLDGSHPAALPDEVFTTPDGPVAVAAGIGSVDINAYGVWSAIPTAGYPGGAGSAVFSDPTHGWIVGGNTLGRIAPSPPPARLAVWPEANRNPLLSVALPPGGSSTTDTPGALTVGLGGAALQYTTAAGWQVTPVPTRVAHLDLHGVAFSAPGRAVAVGAAGTILEWNGTAWTVDPQSNQTPGALNSVAFRSDGTGWAVGQFGTILRYDGTSWIREADPLGGGTNFTSVTVAGGRPYAIGNGNLFTRGTDGSWSQVDLSSLQPAVPADSLRLVSGLPDGGLVVAGKSELLIRQTASAPFTYASRSFQGIPVAASAFRGPAGDVRAFLSVAPPVYGTNDVRFPAGDGDLILQTAGGWDDLGHSQYPVSQPFRDDDGVVQPDPVLAVAASGDGAHAWAVGGYAGTVSASGIGTPAGTPDWWTSAIWRFDVSGTVSAPSTTAASVTLPAQPSTVSFAFLSSALCKVQCSRVAHAQPMVNLNAAASEIAAFAEQPGGPAFAMFGGNAVGPSASGSAASQDPQRVADLGNLPQVMSPLANVPTYAAYGPLDAVSTASDPAGPWAKAFAGAPQPFGPGARPGGIQPLGPDGAANPPDRRYYAFTVAQNGGNLAVIVLDNAAGALGPDQTAWLGRELGQASGAGLPVIVVASRPLNQADVGAASDGDQVARILAAARVLGVFTTSAGTQENGAGVPIQPDQVAEVPTGGPATQPRIPEYEGATMTYQQPKNDGVLWYDVSVNTSTRALAVQGVPVVSSLALEPLRGLSVARSQTLLFKAIGRRPLATIASGGDKEQQFPGYDQYVGIPADACAGCIGPSYAFTSSNPDIGHFVAPSSAGSAYPALTSTGQSTASSTSGLFCGFNPGTTTVSVTSGLMTASLPVTVTDAGVGPPCGAEPGGKSIVTRVIPGGSIVVPGGKPGYQGTASPPPGAVIQTVIPAIHIPPPAPVVQPAPAPASPIAAIGPSAPHFPPAPSPFPLPVPTPAGVPSGFIVPAAAFSPLAASFAPPLPPPLTPIPPGGATAPSAAKREEKARKEASQSAFAIRPAGTSGDDYFLAAVGVLSVISVMLLGAGIKAGPRQRERYAYADLRLGQPDRYRPR